jgi:hypothetical protein
MNKRSSTVQGEYQIRQVDKPLCSRHHEYRTTRPAATTRGTIGEVAVCETEQGTWTQVCPSCKENEKRTELRKGIYK